MNSIIIAGIEAPLNIIFIVLQNNKKSIYSKLNR